MNLNVLSRSFSNIVQNQKVNWLWGVNDHQGLNPGQLERRQVQPAVLLKNPAKSEVRPKLWVEGIKVTADTKHMYCKGCVRSQGIRPRSNVVVAVEWLDEDHKALNTEWKRIEVNPEGKAGPLLPNTRRSFTVKATLDPRVKWVKAYAFSGNH
jgi:hypothetical protein